MLPYKSIPDNNYNTGHLLSQSTNNYQIQISNSTLIDNLIRRCEKLHWRDLSQFASKHFYLWNTKYHWSNLYPLVNPLNEANYCFSPKSISRKDISIDKMQKSWFIFYPLINSFSIAESKCPLSFHIFY